MRDVASSPSLGPNESLVVFSRPGTAAGSGIQPRIFDGETLIGMIETGCRIEYRCSPGQHLFVGLSAEDSRAAVRADLAAGKTYYIQTDLATGKAGFLNWKTVLTFLPVLKTHPDWGKATAYSEMTLRELDPLKRAKLEAEDRKDLEEVRAHFMGPGKDELLTMSAVDGW